MKPVLLTFAIILSAVPAMAQSMTSEEMRAQQKEMQEMMNSPEYKQQMQEAQEMMNSPEYKAQMKDAIKEMKRQGQDTTEMEKNMDPAHMQKNMENAQKQSVKAMDAAIALNECIEKKVGSGGMERMEKEGEAMDKQIQALCKSGKREAAVREEEAYAKKVMASSEYKAMAVCGEKYAATLDDTSKAEFKKQMDLTHKDEKEPHICDSYGKQAAK
jgi:hypothetical protein